VYPVGKSIDSNVGVMPQELPFTLPKPSPLVASRYIAKLLPDYVDLLKKIEKQSGVVQLDPRITQALKNLTITDYAKYYQEADRLSSLIFVGLVGPQAFGELCAELNNAGPQEITQLLDEFLSEHDAFDADALAFFSMTPEQQEAARLEFEALAEEEKQAASLQAQAFWLMFMVFFHEILSIVAHGQPMTHLVAQATAGDDDAFVKAVQVDRSVLTSIPYFSERRQRAEMEGDINFLDRLHYRLTRPTLRGKIRHRELWLVFAVLDWMNLLDGSLKDREILDICEAAQLDPWANRIEDVGCVTKRRLEFKRFQKTGR
jgi:hypothetical protein